VRSIASGKVERLEVVVGHQARAMVGDVVAAQPRRLDRQQRRRCADMAVVGAGGIDHEGVGQAGAARQGAKHAHGHRRAADVAGADEEDPDRHGRRP
jgi:hypothetical protein